MLPNDAAPGRSRGWPNSHARRGECHPRRPVRQCAESVRVWRLFPRGKTRLCVYDTKACVRKTNVRGGGGYARSLFRLPTPADTPISTICNPQSAIRNRKSLPIYIYISDAQLHNDSHFLSAPAARLGVRTTKKPRKFRERLCILPREMYMQLRGDLSFLGGASPDAEERSLAGRDVVCSDRRLWPQRGRTDLAGGRQPPERHFKKKEPRWGERTPC